MHHLHGSLFYWGLNLWSHSFLLGKYSATELCPQTSYAESSQHFGSSIFCNLMTLTYICTCIIVMAKIISLVFEIYVVGQYISIFRISSLNGLCAGYFSITVIKHYDQGNLQESVMVEWRPCSRDSWEVTSQTVGGRGRAPWEWRESQWRTSSNKATPPDHSPSKPIDFSYSNSHTFLFVDSKSYAF